MISGRPVWAEVDLGALERNFEIIRSLTKSEIMPIVKADAYGHGAVKVVETLKAKGVKRFGVALLEEALELKQQFPELTLMVIGPTLPEQAEDFVREGIIPEVYNYAQAKALSEAAVKLGKQAVIHVKIDTGMGRIGFREENTPEILRIADLPCVTIEGIYTHFATADQHDLTYARKQLEIFQRIYNYIKAKGLTIPIRHAANSAAIIQMPEAHFEVVRPGIILYGLPPSLQVGRQLGLESVMSWKAQVAHVKTINTGESVGYGQTFKAAYPTKVATIPVGYADGLRRALSNRGEVLIHGSRSTIIGRICMDQAMLEVTKIPGVTVGDVVTLLGRDGDEVVDATEMAVLVDTINYEIMCGISKRVPRVYTSPSCS